MITQWSSKLFFDDERKIRWIFLTLSLVSGFVELGIIVYFISNNFEITQILLVGLCYQLGNLIASSLALSKRTLTTLLLVALVLVVVIDLFNVVWFYYLIVLIVSVVLQNVRRMAQDNIEGEKVTTFTKRLVRIIGFLLAGLAGNGVATLIFGNALIPILLLICVAIPDSWHSLSTKKDFNGLAAIMVIHQTHYFSYALWVPLILIKDLSISPYFLGFFFILGWLSYINTEKIFGHLDNSVIFIIGHLFVALSLFLLNYGQNNILYFSAAWFFSGLGGGSIYCLKRISKEKYTDSADYLDFWEDVGHVMGIAFSILLFVIWDRSYKPFIVSSGVALVTAFLMVTYFIRTKKNKKMGAV